MFLTHRIVLACSLLALAAGCALDQPSQGDPTEDDQLAGEAVDGPAGPPQAEAEHPGTAEMRAADRPTVRPSDKAEADASSACTITYMGDYDWNPTYNIQETFMNYSCTPGVISVTTHMKIVESFTIYSIVFTGPSHSNSTTSGSDEYDINYTTQPNSCWRGTGYVTYQYYAPGWDCTQYVNVCVYSDSVLYTKTVSAYGPQVCGPPPATM